MMLSRVAGASVEAPEMVTLVSSRSKDWAKSHKKLQHHILPGGHVAGAHAENSITVHIEGDLTSPTGRREQPTPCYDDASICGMPAGAGAIPPNAHIYFNGSSQTAPQVLDPRRRFNAQLVHSCI